MQTKKVLVTGSSGMLGSQFISLMQEHYLASPLLAGTDISDNSSITKALNDASPDVVIHAAAFTDVDGCQQDPDKCHRINVLGTENIVNYCVSNNVKMVYISSTGIYGDSKEINYSEDDEPIPTTIHHASKLKSEIIIRNMLTDYLILRVGWLYGGSINQRNNFVYKRFLEAKNKRVIYSSSTQIGNPTNCKDVVSQACLLINNNQRGVFNCVNGGVGVTRYDYVKEIIDQFRLDCRVELASLDMFKRAAPVSCNESAINKNLDNIGLNIMPYWKTALARYIKELEL